MTSQSCIKGFEFGDNNNDQNTNPPNDCTTGIILSSQKEIDKFSKDHSDCTQIFGNLIIGRDDVGSFITNLNGLRQVTKINGDLIIERCITLKNLKGLDNITEVSGIVLVRSNEVLESMDGLTNLSTIGSSLDINNNPGLMNLNGLEKLTTLGKC